MEFEFAVEAFAALSQNTRLQAFRLLVTAGPQGLPAGQVAQELGIAANTLSFHLAALKNAGLVRCRREGRLQIYSTDFQAMRDLIGFLSENCCARAKE